MVIRGKEFNEIFDLVGVRILVDSLRDTYAALGAVHALWKPIPGRFKDYVAMPKSNMYAVAARRSSGPGQAARDPDPHARHARTAKYGIAAHWRYKEAAGQGGLRRGRVARTDDGLAEGHGRPARVHGLAADRPLRGQVFMFTPKGDVVNLPAGATPVDFAYAIHTDVGHRTIGAKIGGKLVPLDYELRTGDTVEVLAARAGRRAITGLAPVREDAARAVQDPSVVLARASRGRPGAGPRLGDAPDAQTEPSDQAPGDDRVARHRRRGTQVPEPRGALRRRRRGHVSPQSIVARVSRLVVGDTDEEHVAEVPLAGR